MRALVRERLGGDADDAFCAACHDATGGNPLLLRQLLRALEAEGVRPDAGQAAVVRAIGPRAVSGTVLLRLARLSDDARGVARAAAVLGESAALLPVAVMAGCDERAAAAATGELIRAEILRPDPPLGFVHPLVRDAVYHEVPPAERELEHEHAAQVLRDAGAGDEHVAAQLLVAPRRGSAWVVELLERAGGTALRKGAADSAVAYLRRALEEPPPPERRTAVLTALGTAEGLTSGPAAAEHLQQAYDALEDPRERGSLALPLFSALLFTGSPAAAAAVAERAAAALPEADADQRRMLEAMALATHFFSGTGMELPDRMAGHRHPPAAPGPGARALAGVSSYDWINRGGSASETAALALSGLENGELIASGSGLLVIISAVTLVLADRPEGLEALATLEAAAHRRGSLLDIASVHLWIGYTRWRHGQVEEAEQMVRTANQEFEIYGLGPGPRAYGDAFQCQILIERGDLPGARRALLHSADQGDESDAARHWQHAQHRAAGRRGELGGGAGRVRGVRRRASPPTPTPPARPGACTGRRRSTSSGAPPRRSSSPASSSRSRAASTRPRASARRCACSAGSSATPAWSGWRRRPPCWPAATRGWSTRRRCSRSARRCATRAARPRRASRCARRWSWPRPAARRCWPTPPARSSTRPAPGRAPMRCPASGR